MTNIQSKQINSDNLRALGFSQAEIDTAEEMEARGLFAIEPSADLVKRTVEKCLELLPPAPKMEPIPIYAYEPLGVARVQVPGLEGLSPALRQSPALAAVSRLQAFPQACLATIEFVRSRKERPFVMLDNHNVMDPAWWQNDTGFRAFWNACQVANRFAKESGVQPAAIVEVLRPDLDAYSNDDLAAMEDMLRRGTSDVWWIPFERAGAYKAQDFIVLGEELTLQLDQKPPSPVRAMEAFHEITRPDVVMQCRRGVLEVARSAVSIRQEGKLADFATRTLKGLNGVRDLIRLVSSGHIDAVAPSGAASASSTAWKG